MLIIGAVGDTLAASTVAKTPNSLIYARMVERVVPNALLRNGAAGALYLSEIVGSLAGRPWEISVDATQCHS